MNIVRVGFIHDSIESVVNTDLLADFVAVYTEFNRALPNFREEFVVHLYENKSIKTEQRVSSVKNIVFGLSTHRDTLASTEK
jgi:NAD(P)H-hydrate repair Nnr-like enzyme with NAD(P)H-hydrate dehydratase domain